MFSKRELGPTDEEVEDIRAAALLKAALSGHLARPNPDMKKGEERIAQARMKLEDTPTAEVWASFAKRKPRR